jgi:hypothetical protein
MKSIYELELFEELVYYRDGDKFDPYTNTIVRVPGGWIFKFKEPGTRYSTCFVPFDNEFQK